MTDRFDLEQEIMKCWNVTDDLDLVIDKFEELELSAKQYDEMLNLLLGIKTLYQAKFEKLFETFGNYIKEDVGTISKSAEWPFDN